MRVGGLHKSSPDFPARSDSEIPESKASPKNQHRLYFWPKKTFISSILLAKILDTLAFIFIFFLTSKTYLMISCAKNKLGQIKTTAVRRELRGRGE